VGTWWRISTRGAYDPVLLGYDSMFAVVLSAALFLLCKEWFAERQLGRMTAKTVGVIAPLVLGVYLVHTLAIMWLTHGAPVRSVGLQIGYYLAELGLSVVCVVVLSTIKPLCYLFLGQRFSPWWRRKKKEQDTKTTASRLTPLDPDSAR
jgi:surface polysaccharide O-acyltransferase-like enzyme